VSYGGVLALQALAAALVAVPTTFRSLIAALEQLLWDIITGDDVAAPLRLAASQCFSLLPNVTGWAPT
jgi:hypothetical protein